MATETWAIAMVVFATLIGAFGSLCFKTGSDKLTRDIKKLLTNYRIMLGFLLYSISSIFFIIGLRGGELSVLYPLVAVGYVWICLLSIKFLKEKMNTWKWLGIIFIMVGVSLIGIGS